jgi:flagellar L-ring protein precursor FlgH
MIMVMARWHRVLLVALLAAAASACTSIAGQRPGRYPPAMPVTRVAEPVSGTVYQPATAVTLFDDVKARRVGDTLTVLLEERTQASKSAQTDAKKDSTVSTGAPTLLGRTPTRNGDPFLTNEWTTGQEFGGDGASTQSNRLDGSITVTVAEVYPNGNLLVRGEKWLTLNQGEEFVQVTGIVRPTDIGADNTVPSFKVADAQIIYSGSGFVADSNRPGLLSRFFMKLWPL